MARASQGVDIELLGDRRLSRKLARLPVALQRKIARNALRGSARRLKTHVVANLSGEPIRVRTGVTRAAFRGARIKSMTRRGVIRIGPQLPTREALHIEPDDEYYYPNWLEYKHASFIRSAVDQHEDEEKRQIARDIRAGIIREARRG